MREHIEADIKTANRLVSLHCGHRRPLRMRRCRTILQCGSHSPLCSRFHGVSLFGRITNGRVHSVASEQHALLEISQTLRKSHEPRRREESVALYVPSGNSTCVRDMDRHRGGAEHCSSNAILPGHNRAVPVKRPQTRVGPMACGAARSSGPRRRRSRPIRAARCR